ncbi:MAG: trypsin-like peptidase domain-containing protein [Erysipelotrichaceae bacterium]
MKNKPFLKSITVIGIVMTMTFGNIAYTYYGTTQYQAKISELEATVAKLQATESSNATNVSYLNGGVGSSAIASKVIPSVVGIEVTAQVTVNYGPFGSQTSTQTSSGSGIIYSSDGYIITNYHVVASYVESRSTGSMKVILSDGKSYSATYVGGDATNDLAVLKITATGLTAATFDTTNDLKVGDYAMAIGYPLGMDLASSVTVGVVSGIHRSVDTQNSKLTLIQTDAAINPGNSGGALVNSAGAIIGINNSKIASTSVEGIGFAIPIDYAMPIIKSIISANK